MATIDIQFRLNVRNWLIGALEANAEWREAKAVDYPDDSRNARAGAALRAAANHVLYASESPGVDRFAELVKAAEESGIAVIHDAPEFPGEEAQRIASRYYFDNLPGQPTFQDHERFLLELHDASLRGLREWSLPLDSPLGRLIAEEAPVDAEPSEIALLAEIRDLVREVRDHIVSAP